MKFDRLGLPAKAASCTRLPVPQDNGAYSSYSRKDEIFGAAYASAVYISSVLRLPRDEKVYVIGGAGMEEDLDEEGIKHLGGTVSERSVISVYHPACPSISSGSSRQDTRRFRHNQIRPRP